MKVPKTMSCQSICIIAHVWFDTQDIADFKCSLMSVIGLTNQIWTVNIEIYTQIVMK